MSSLDALAYLLWSLIGAAVVVALAMLPAWLLAVAHRSGRPPVLWILATALSLALFALFVIPGIAARDWISNLFAGFTTLAPAFTSAAALSAGMGRGHPRQQVLGAGSVGILTAALPFMLFGMFLGRWPTRVMALTALLLTVYVMARHVHTYKRHPHRENGNVPAV